MRRFLVAPKHEPKLEVIEELPVNPEVKTDLDRVAEAVAWAETHNCELGYGKEYNNCFGIKNGNTAPCDKIGRSNMCIYDKPADSYAAFKIIWTRWYGGGLPTREGAARWTGNDRPDSWIANVKSYYHNNT